MPPRGARGDAARHAGGPTLAAEPSIPKLLDFLERVLDDAGFERAHVVGNSLGGYLALKLAERGRAETVVALAPAGGWAPGEAMLRGLLARQLALREAIRSGLRSLDALLATPAGRRRATQEIACHGERIPPELIAHLLTGALACADAPLLAAAALSERWQLDAARIACPLRIVWGREDAILPWSAAAEHFRASVLPHADWVVLDGVGHCPQLDAPLETAQLVLDWTSR